MLLGQTSVKRFASCQCNRCRRDDGWWSPRGCNGDTTDLVLVAMKVIDTEPVNYSKRCPNGGMHHSHSRSLKTCLGMFQGIDRPRKLTVHNLIERLGAAPEQDLLHIILSLQTTFTRMHLHFLPWKMQINCWERSLLQPASRHPPTPTPTPELRLLPARQLRGCGSGGRVRHLLIGRLAILSLVWSLWSACQSILGRDIKPRVGPHTFTGV